MITLEQLQLKVPRSLSQRATLMFLSALIAFSALTAALMLPSYPTILGPPDTTERHIAWALTVAEKGVLPYATTGPYSIEGWFPPFLFPPLFHVLFGALIMICGVNSWVQIYFLTVGLALMLQAFLALPVFVLGKRLGGEVAGLVSAFFVSTTLLKFETFCRGEYPMLLSFLFMGFLAVAISSRPSINWASVSTLLTLGIFVTHSIASVILGFTVVVFSLVDTPFGRERAKRMVALLPPLLIVIFSAAFFLVTPQSQGWMFAHLGTRSMWEFFYRILKTNWVGRLLSSKKLYDWWNLAWRLGYLPLTLAPAGLLASRRKSGSCLRFLTIWTLLSFILYYGYIFGVPGGRFIWDYLRFLQCTIIPLTVFAGVGLNHIVLTRRSAALLLIMLSVSTVVAVTFILSAQNDIIYYYSHKDRLTTLPLKSI